MKLKLDINPGPVRSMIIPKLVSGFDADQLEDIEEITYELDTAGYSKAVIVVRDVQIEGKAIPDNKNNSWNVSYKGYGAPIIQDDTSKDLASALKSINFTTSASNPLVLNLTPALPLFSVDTTQVASANGPCTHGEGKYLCFTNYRCNRCNEIV